MLPPLLHVFGRICVSGQLGGVSRENLIIYAVIAVIVLVRASFPQRISVMRMWISAGILMLVAALATYGSIVLVNPPLWQVAASIALGLVAGIPLGLLRGHHTQVSATERHGVMRLGASWATAAIYLGAFAGRVLIRAFVSPASSIGMVAGDGLLVFAIAIIGATYFAVYRKYERLDHAAVQAR
jgi:hypothetical protein